MAWSRSALRWCAVAPLPLLLTACHWAVLDPRGPVGQADRTILIDSLAIMLAIGVPTILATFAFAWWFRASNTRARYRPDWEFSGAIELVVWAIPAMVIILLGGVAWIGIARARPGQALSERAGSGRDPGRIARLEVALHLSAGRGREREPARRAGGRAAALLAHVGERLERLLRAATRQHDLRDERHADPDEPSGRRDGDVPGPVGALQRRRLLRHALPGPGRARSDEFAAWVKATRGVGPTPRWRRLHGARTAEHEPAAFDVRSA